MPDSISALATKNFDGATLIHPDEMNSLMQKEGRFTLDDAGRLAVINPPSRRDGGFVRFFKGLFSSSYRAEQRMLDRMEVLARNASFNAVLRASIGNFHPAGMERVESFTWNRTFNEVLQRIQPSADNPLSTAQLRQAAATATHLADAMRAPSSAFSARDGSVMPILTEHGPKSLDEFISAHRTKTTDLPGFADVSRAVCLNVLTGKNMGNLLSQDDCSRFVGLTAQSGLSAEEDEELLGLRRKAEQNVVNALSSFASKALEEGADPATLANHLGDVLTTLGNGSNGADAILRAQLSNPAAFAETHRAERPGAPQLQETPHSAVALRAMGGDALKAARLVLYCEAHHISPDQLESALKMAKGMGQLLTAGNYRENLLACDSVLKNLHREIQAQILANQDFGADDYIPLFTTATFASWLEGDCKPLNFSALRTLCTAYLDIASEARSSDAPRLQFMALLLHTATSALTSVQQAVEGHQNTAPDEGQSPASLKRSIRDLARRTELAVQIEDFLHGVVAARVLTDNGLQPNYDELEPEARAFLEDNLKLAALQAGPTGLNEVGLEETLRSLLPIARDPEGALRQTAESFVGHMRAVPVDSGALLRDMVQIYRNLSASVRTTDIETAAMRPLLIDAFRSQDHGALEAAYHALSSDPAAKNLIAITDGFTFTSAVSELVEGTPNSLMTERECRVMLAMFGQVWSDTIEALDEVLGRTGADGDSPARVMYNAAMGMEMEDVPLDIHGQVRSLLNEMGLNADAHPYLLKEFIS